MEQTIRRFMTGRVARVDPVHASKACLWHIIQSTVPSRCTVASEVMGDLVEIRAVTGVVEVIFW